MKLNFKSINWAKLSAKFIIGFFLLLFKLSILTSFCWIGLHQIKDIIHIINTNTISIGSAINIALWLYPMIVLYHFFTKINIIENEFWEEEEK
jgi:hypothetical protein